MNVVHVVRDTVDWGSLTLESYYNQPFDNSFVKSQMLEMIKKWNSKLSPNYFKFRNSVVEIASDNHRMLEADFKLKSSRNLESFVKNISKPYVVLFTDDDDWHSPDVTKMLRDQYSQNESLEAIIWDHYSFLTNYKIFNWDKKTPYFIKAARGFFHTNNYALTDKFWDRLTKDDIEFLHTGVKEDLCYGHNMIDRRFKSLIKFKEVKGKVYSVSSKTITSYSALIKRNHDLPTQNDLLGELCQIVETCKTSKLDIPPEIDWAFEEVNKTMKIYKDIKFKKSIL
jgi:hypothetical protein